MVRAIAQVIGDRLLQRSRVRTRARKHRRQHDFKSGAHHLTRHIDFAACRVCQSSVAGAFRNRDHRWQEVQELLAAKQRGGRAPLPAPSSALGNRYRMTQQRLRAPGVPSHPFQNSPLRPPALGGSALGSSRRAFCILLATSSNADVLCGSSNPAVLLCSGVWGLLSFIGLIAWLRWQGVHSSARNEPTAKPPELLRRR